jgi:DNA topoisomerase-1
VYANIPKGEEPEAVTLERGIELIKAKLEGARAKVLKEFDGSEIQVLAGRYGPYITDGNKNANVPKGKEAADVTLDEAVKLLADAPERKGKKKAAPKKAAAKKAAPKKKAAKKKAAPKKKAATKK